MRTALVLLLAISSYLARASGPDVSAKSAIVIDAASGKTLWEKDADTPRFPASTTKIMTALLLIERCSPDEVITAPEDIAKVREASLHLKPGEQVTAKEMLYALMLRSANDGCYAVAVHISGSVKAFSALMNRRAEEIGCTHTHFDNPNGLNDDHHFTSAHDLALMGREAMKYAQFREVVHTVKHTIVRSMNQSDRILVSKNKMLRKDPTADGIKTGWTIPAGHCYVGSATRNGYRIITVVMKSPHWQLDHEAMLNWGFKSFRRQVVASAGEQIDRAPISGAKAPDVGVGPETDVSIAEPVNFVGTFTHRIILKPNLAAPIEKGDRVGEVEFSDGSGFSERVPLVAVAAAPKTSALPTNGRKGLGFVLFAGFMGGGVYYMRGRSRRLNPYGTPTQTETPR